MAGQAERVMEMMRKAYLATVEGEAMAEAGLKTATEIVKIRPEDLKAQLPNLLDKAAEGDDAISGAIRVIAAYERFHLAALERLHPTDNLLNGKGNQASLLAEMFKELSFQMKVYFCSMFQKVFSQSGEQLKQIIVNTVNETLEQRKTIKEVIENGIHTIIHEMLGNERTKEASMKYLRGDCLVMEFESRETRPITVISGGAGASNLLKGLSGAAKNIDVDKLSKNVSKVSENVDKMSDVSSKMSNISSKMPNISSKMPSMPPQVTTPVGDKGPTPFIEIDYMDTPDKLKKFICDAYQRMFTDKWHSLMDVALTTIEGAMRNNEEIKRMNQATIRGIIDQIFESPQTKEEFIRHLSGGCAVPRKPQEYIFKPKNMPASSQQKQISPTEVFTKYIAPSYSSSKIYRGGRRITRKKR